MNDLLSGLKSIIAQSNSGNNTGEEDVMKLYQKGKPAIDLFKLLNEVQNTLVGYTKLYKSEDQEHGLVVNYNDNEWRYIVPSDNDHKWLHGEKEYIAWRGDTTQKPSSTFDAIVFNSDDIRYIIVEKEIDARKLIADILRMKTIEGNRIEDKNTLISMKLQMIKNIISIERLDEDF